MKVSTLTKSPTSFLFSRLLKVPPSETPPGWAKRHLCGPKKAEAFIVKSFQYQFQSRLCQSPSLTLLQSKAFVSRAHGWLGGGRPWTACGTLGSLFCPRSRLLNSLWQSGMDSHTSKHTHKWKATTSNYVLVRAPKSQRDTLTSARMTYVLMICLCSLI